MWNQYYSVATIDQALDILNNENPNARIIAGGTDLVLEYKQGLHESIHTLIDISRIKGIHNIWQDETGYIHVGAGATHNDCVASKLILEKAFPLAQACYGIGSPQIRNVATVVGNLVTASPANDTICVLIALDAKLFVRSKSGNREIFLKDFYTGVRKTVLNPDEMIVEISFKGIQEFTYGVFNKYLLRKSHAISLVNTTVVITLDQNKITKSAVALGCVAPTVIRSSLAESFLLGKELCEEVIEECSIIAQQDARPISDIRGSDKYRDRLIKYLVSAGLRLIWKKEFINDPVYKPVLLRGQNDLPNPELNDVFVHDKNSIIDVQINDEKYSLENGSGLTILDLVREKAGLPGTKLGCGEGECGACTLFLDDLPVLSCLIPAARAHLARITTIEGVSEGGKLNNIQNAFIEEGAVQCGYCTPGFIMSTIKLLDEIKEPSVQEIKSGLSGNLCRCTGYYRIIAAVEKAAKLSAQQEVTNE